MSFSTLTLSIDDGIGRITLSRPDNANALDPTMSRELLEAASGDPLQSPQPHLPKREQGHFPPPC